MVTDDGQLMDDGGRLPQALVVALALAEGRLVPGLAPGLRQLANPGQLGGMR